MPKILTERSASLSYVKEDLGEDKHYLGKLAGIGAEFNRPTRNGRRYPLQLWKNIQASEDFKEGMSTHTIFGECDHPEERVETSIKEIAIVLTKYEIRESEGNVYTEFHILDTPNGRILKELLDYGSQIGVSTRGLGDEIVQDGETIINPETYVFYGWDAVVIPAVKSARPKVVESKKVSLIESFNREIESASSKAELESLKRTVSKLPELGSVSESINIKLKSMTDGEDISSKLEEDLGRISEENVKLNEEINALKAKLSANNIRIQKLSEANHNYSESMKSLRSRLQEHMVTTAKLETEAFDSAIESDENAKLLQQNKHKLESYGRKIRSLEKDNKLSEAKLSDAKSKLTKSMNESAKLRASISELKSKDANKVESLNNEISKLTESIARIKSENIELKKTNLKLQEQAKASSNKQMLTEKKSMNELSSYKKVIAQKDTAIVKTLEKYLQTKCAQNGIKVNTVQRLLPENYSSEDIDKIVKELADRKRRYDALPFAMPLQSVKIVENKALSNADKQTMDFLSEVCK